MNTQGNGVFPAVLIVLGVTLGAGVATVSLLRVVPLGVIGGYPFGRELFMVSVAISVNRVAMGVMAEVALKVCALFIEDPVGARALAPATVPHGVQDVQ